MARNQKSDWKDRLGVVYSTGDNFDYDYNSEEDAETLPSSKQKLYVSLDKKPRRGKQVTLITGFVGKEDDLKDLSKLLKSKCGEGGTAKLGEIIIQGDLRDKVCNLLEQKGYSARKI